MRQSCDSFCVHNLHGQLLLALLQLITFVYTTAIYNLYALPRLLTFVCTIVQMWHLLQTDKGYTFWLLKLLLQLNNIKILCNILNNDYKNRNITNINLQTFNHITFMTLKVDLIPLSSIWKSLNKWLGPSIVPFCRVPFC